MLATDRPFASVATTFGDLVDYDHKLIVTEAVPLDSGQPADSLCLISAVRLTPRADATPPRRDRTRHTFAQFCGAWKPTPMGAGPKGKNILGICAPFLRVDGFDDALMNALKTPDSFDIRDWTGSLLQVYAPGRRLAVSIRLAQRKSGR